MNEQLELNVGVSKRVRLLPDAEPKLVIDVEGEVTEWFDGEPPCSGWWEVECSDGVHRLWYTKERGSYILLNGSEVSRLWMNAKYRGLKAPSHQMFIHTATATRLSRVKLLS